jgi:hypothetical protein
MDGETRSPASKAWRKINFPDRARIFIELLQDTDKDGSIGRDIVKILAVLNESTILECLLNAFIRVKFLCFKL